MSIFPYYVTDSTNSPPWTWTVPEELPGKLKRLERLEAERWARRRGRLLALELDCRIKEGLV